MAQRILVVAPSWVGDAILSEPLIARLHARHGNPTIDVLAPAWCAPLYARMRGVGEVFDSGLAHGRVDLARRRALARTLARSDYAQAVVLPNSWKSALVPWLARIPVRTGYVGELRWGLINDTRRLDRAALPRLVDRYAALAANRDSTPAPASAPVLVPDRANRAAAIAALALDTGRRVAILCPGAEYGPAKRWPTEHFAALAAKLGADGFDVWLVGSPKDKESTAAIVATWQNVGGTMATSGPPTGGAGRGALRDLAGRTDLGTAIDLLSAAAVVVSNDSGLMHAAAAVGAPLVALFGSSSPVYTPPLSPGAAIARIEIACSPCFKRECPLGHFRCMRDLAPAAVYDLARPALASAPPAPETRPAP